MIRSAPRVGVSADSVARLLRRCVVAIGAAGLLVLPQFPTNAAYIGVPGLPGPLVVLAIGLAFVLMPILVVSSWVAEGRARLVHAWLAVPAGLFVAGAAVSTALAADKSSALVRAAEIAGLWVGMFALVQAIRSDGERRFLLAALVAAALVSAAVALHQATVGMEETWEYFQQHREEVLARHGIPPGSWMEQVFIGRFTGGVQAALGHPNVLAALLVPAVLVAVGLVREKRSEAGSRGARGLAVAVAVAAAVGAAALFCTESRAGLAALGVGLWWLAVAWWVRRRAWRIALYLAPLALAAAGIAVAAHLDHPAVVGALKTLRYRLDYWRATAEVLRLHPLAGVGLENFGLHYLEFKLPTAPEEVRDPHNLFLSVWSQVGLAGLAAIVGLVVVAGREWLRASLRDPSGGPQGPFAEVAGDAAPAEPLTGLLVPTMAIAAPAVIVYFMMGWPLGVAAVAAMTMVMGLASGEEPSRMAVAGRPLGALRTAAVVALAAFALMEQIGTAVLEPPTAWAMLVVLAASLGPGREFRARRRLVRGSLGEGGIAGASAPTDDLPPGVPLRAPVKFLLMAAAMAAGFAYVRFLVVPVGREESLLVATGQASKAAEKDVALRGAGEANPLAWEPAMIRGHLWQQEAARQEEGPYAAACTERAIEAYRESLQRQPRLRRAWLRMAECRMMLPGAHENPAALEAALEYTDQAVRLYPTDIPTRLRRADLLDRLKRDAEALGEYRRVLELDRVMPDENRRLKDDRRRAMEGRVRELQESLAAPAAKHK